MVERFDPYRISGVLEQVDGRWLWRHLRASLFLHPGLKLESLLAWQIPVVADSLLAYRSGSNPVVWQLDPNLRHSWA